MYISTSLLVAALAGSAFAQGSATSSKAPAASSSSAPKGGNGGGDGGGNGNAVTPKGFTPSASTKLDVVFNTTTVKTPGELLSKAATASAPQLAIPAAMGNASDTFMFVMLDLDVPPAQGATARRTLLHAMETGFQATKQKLGGTGTLLATKAKGPAAYMAPGPPATDTVAHRYVQLLFKEPAALKVQASDFSNTTARIGFDINAFMKQHQLAEPVAGNFFMVDGRANSTAGNGNGGGKGGNGNGNGNGNGAARGSGSATGTGSTPKSSTKPFEGAAGRREVSYGFVGTVAGLALLAL